VEAGEWGILMRIVALFCALGLLLGAAWIGFHAAYHSWHPCDWLLQDMVEDALVRRGIEVDDRLSTSNPRVYAIGDIASPFQLTHVADAHARMVVRNALFFGRAKASDLVIPWATYTSPELAHVGILPDEAAQSAFEIFFRILR
jgi:hypothetical protein